jgi:hypothetical protein
MLSIYLKPEIEAQVKIFFIKNRNIIVQNASGNNHNLWIFCGIKVHVYLVKGDNFPAGDHKNQKGKCFKKLERTLYHLS